MGWFIQPILFTESSHILIKNIKGKGYEIVTVSDLIYKDNYAIDNNGVQHKL